MKDTEIRTLEMLIRVRQFGVTHERRFPEDTRGGELLAQVNAAVSDMEELSATQASHARAAKEKTTQKRAAYEALRDVMEAIGRTARAMERATPGLRDKFRLPHNAGEQTWLASARGFAADAEPLKDEFIRRGMHADFLEDLRARIETVENFIDGRAEKAGARVSATVAVAQAAERGRGAVRELDAIVRNVCRGDLSALSEWESASRVERPARRAKQEAPAAAPAPAQG